MVKPAGTKGLLVLLCFGAAVGLSVPAHAQRTPHGPLILNTSWYSPGDPPFPYAVRALPKTGWLGFAYSPPGALRRPCKLVRTAISIKQEEVGEQQGEIMTYVVANSGTPRYLFHGIGLQPGPIDCAQVKTRFANAGVALNDNSVGEKPIVLATFLLRNQSGQILANRVHGKMRLMMQYQAQNQVLMESSSRKPMLLYVDVIADLDRDGRPDAIVSEGRGALSGNPDSHVKLYLSSKAAGGQLVGEVASY